MANPMGAVLASAMMFESFGWTAEAQAIETAVRAALREQETTPDLGGDLGTRELGDWLASATLIRGKSC
jgi:3-isopropylmalate dehydrogenase